MSDELSCGQARDWHTHTLTHRPTDAADDNTWRPKLASGKNELTFITTILAPLFLTHARVFLLSAEIYYLIYWGLNNCSNFAGHTFKSFFVNICKRNGIQILVQLSIICDKVNFYTRCLNHLSLQVSALYTLQAGYLTVSFLQIIMVRCLKLPP